VSAAEANPLLVSATIIPFDAVRAEHVVPAIEHHLAASRAAVRAIVDEPGPRTWANTLQALDRATEPLEDAFQVVSHLRTVAHDDALAEAHAAVTPLVSGWFTSLAMNTELFEAVKAYARTEEARALTGARRRFLEKTLDDFKRQGAELSSDKKAKFEQVSTELATLATTFSTHVLKSTQAWSLHLTDPARLSGLPASIVDQLRQAAAARELDGWRVTLATPVVLGVLRYADDAELRRAVWEAWNQRADRPPHDNTEVIRRMLELRSEQASLLGYAHFADYVLDDRMAHEGAVAQAFITELATRARPAYEREHDELADFRERLEGTRELGPHDVSYYAERLRQQVCDFDDEALRPYFPLPRVLNGLFDLVSRLYGLQFQRVGSLPTWHPDVQTWQVREADGRVLGVFYVDLHPRETKRDGAWMSPLRVGLRGERGDTPHVGLIAANVTPPTNDRPALLVHREVETLAHELGHLLHHLLSEVEVRSLAGTSVAWDFVELPSQIMENWCWRRESLDLLAAHWETGEPIPDELFDGMTRARLYRKATALLRQVGLAHTDLALHTRYDPTRDRDVVAWSRELMQPFTPAPLPDDFAMITSFSHLFAGATAYAAGYYSYLWAGVLDADAFTRFEAAGLFDEGVGSAFREQILSRGGSDDPAALFERFMGRPPDQQALLRREGLVATDR
jgi:oligopeptidase A